VSWEYSSIMDLWSDAAQKANSTAPEAVLTAMKDDGKGKHIYGQAEWWGKELFGIDNALVGNWPVVVIEDGKAKIKEFKSIPAWWSKNKDLMIKHMTALDQMYFQRK
jgi:branched-chain amino acid transport system substrate-binding protein